MAIVSEVKVFGSAKRAPSAGNETIVCLCTREATRAEVPPLRRLD
jgi:hypothetical protein